MGDTLIDKAIKLNSAKDKTAGNASHPRHAGQI